MPKGTNQKLKLYRLAQIMLEKTDEEHYITMPEIMKELGRYDITANRKSIYNDLRDFGRDVMLIPADAEHITVNVDVRVSRQFLAWIFSLGPQVQILGPEEVVEDMRAEARRLFSQYEKSDTAM